MTGGAFKLLRARKRQAITPQGTRDWKRTRERGGTRAGRSISGTCTIRQRRRPRSTFARTGGAGSRGLRGTARTVADVSEVTLAIWEPGGASSCENIVSYLKFELESGGTRVPLSLAHSRSSSSSSVTVCAHLSSHDCSLMHWLDWYKCGLFPEE